jgi:hypothetical protein
VRKFLVAVVASIVASAIFFVVIEPRLGGLFRSEPRPLPIVSCLEYKIVLRMAGPSLDTVDLDNMVTPNEDFCFHVKFDRPGSVYLLHEDADGSMKWVNALPGLRVQNGRAGDWLRIPQKETQWVDLNADLVPEKFLMIFASSGSTWPPERPLPGVSSMRNGFPSLTSDAAAEIKRSIERDGVRMESRATKIDRTISYELMAVADLDIVGFCEFSLVPKQ